MSQETSRAYNRGYYAASRSWYPRMKPPLPDNVIMAELITATVGLCDAVDAILATLDPDDEFTKELGPHLDRALTAVDEYKQWLRSSRDSE